MPDSEPVLQKILRRPVILYIPGKKEESVPDTVLCPVFETAG